MFDITISGGIDDDSFVKFSEELQSLQAGERSKAVEVLLISDGGSAYSAMAFYDLIRMSSITVNITVIGCAFSAATLILAAGHRRRMTRNAWVMTHEDSASDVKKSMSVSQAENEMLHLRRLESQWNELLAHRTNISETAWADMNKAVTYLSAEDCLKLGLIEEIV